MLKNWLPDWNTCCLNSPSSIPTESFQGNELPCRERQYTIDGVGAIGSFLAAGSGEGIPDSSAFRSFEVPGPVEKWLIKEYPGIEVKDVSSVNLQWCSVQGSVQVQDG
jgi:hypothetical protein